MNFKKSIELHERSSRSLAGGVSSHHRRGELPVPLFFDRAKGSRLFDVDGNEFIDYIMGNGAAIFGHSPDFLLDSVRQMLDRGQIIAGQHDLEIKVAELINDSVPSSEMVRFGSSGTEAVLATIRIARAYTNRSLIIKFEGHYHGWADPVLYSVAPNTQDAGPYDSPLPVPESQGQSPGSAEEVIVLPWNDLNVVSNAIQKHPGEIAAIIMEPVPVNTNSAFPNPGYLEGVRKLCNENGILLIFDEVITGFRLAVGGAQELLGITPDLTTLAKAAAGGFPFSVIAGKREVMQPVSQGRVMHAGTASGNLVSLAAAETTINKLKENDGQAIRNLHHVGELLMDGLRQLARKHEEDVLVQGPSPIFTMAFTAESTLPDYRAFYEKVDHQRYVTFRQNLLEGGIRANMHGKWFLSCAHTEQDVEQTLAAADQAFRSL